MRKKKNTFIVIAIVAIILIIIIIQRILDAVFTKEYPSLGFSTIII